MNKRTSARKKERAIERASDSTNEHAKGRTNERSSERFNERARKMNERTNGPTIERVSERTNQRTSARKDDRATERANERTKEWMSGMREKKANFLFIKRDFIDYWTNYFFLNHHSLSVRIIICCLQESKELVTYRRAQEEAFFPERR